jgi:hypothetical protein
MAESIDHQIDNHTNSRLILPKFWHKSFLFEDGEMPDHINQYPYFARYSGMHEVLSTGPTGNMYRVAVDVEQFATAVLLAKARERHQLKSIELYGYAEPVLIQRPDNSLVMFSEGKAIKN